MRRAHFDLPFVAPRAINLLSDDGRSIQARSSLALADVSAVVNADGDGLGIEIGLQHGG
jgi:hypothetical protein